MWLQHPNFPQIVNYFWSTNTQTITQALSNFGSYLSSWNKHVFGNVFNRKKRILAKLEGIEKALSTHNSHNLLLLHKELAADYQAILLEEEDLWKMKSKINWLNDGDCNTKFFHLSTITRRKSNKIHMILDDSNNELWSPLEVRNHVTDSFQRLSTSCKSQCAIYSNLEPTWKPPPPPISPSHITLTFAPFYLRMKSLVLSSHSTHSRFRVKMAFMLFSSRNFGPTQKTSSAPLSHSFSTLVHFLKI
ncbi:hypothetical protein SLA2020_198870 [Shorea laevis]